MIETFTQHNTPNLPEHFNLENQEDADINNEVFYQQLRPRLNQLVKQPSPETIAKILAFAIKK